MILLPLALIAVVQAEPVGRCLGVQRFIKPASSGTRYLAIEVLDDDILHFEASEYRKPPSQQAPLYYTQMVDGDNYDQNYKCGPKTFTPSADYSTFSTGILDVTIDPATLSVTVFDRNLKTTLTNFSFADMNQNLNKLQWTKERTEAVYGIAAAFSADSTFGSPDGNFLGKKYGPSMPQNKPKDAIRFGNNMEVFDMGAAANTNFPVMYALGTNYQWAMFLDNIYRHDWDLSDSNGKYYVNMWGTIRFYVFAGSSLKDLRAKYMKLVGAPKVPPREVFGMQHSLYGFKSFDEIFKNLEATRSAKIPIDGIVVDLYWFAGQKEAWPNGDPTLSSFGSFNWDLSAFPDPTKNVQKMRSQYGVGLTLIEEPYLPNQRETYKLLANNFALAKESVFGPPTTISYNPWWGVGGIIDWTAPGSDLWMDCKRCALLQGCVVKNPKCVGMPTTPKVDVVNHWIDLGEPEMYNDNAVYNGYQDDQGKWFVNQGDVHNIYQLLSSKSLYDGYVRNGMRRRPSSIVRTGSPGIQRYGSALWSGDISCYLPVQGSHFGAQKHIIMGGIDFFGSDVGGFHREGCVNRNIDMGMSYSRWVMNSVWMDVPFRPHADQHVNGRLDSKIQTNPAWIGNVASNRFNIVQRYQLIPYYYTLAHRANLFREPVFQPMFMAFQNDKNTWSMGSQFMLGDGLLICTDTQYGTQNKTVYLPAGKWYDYHTHEIIKSTGMNIQRSLNLVVDGNPIQTLPVFAKAGSIVPRAYVDDQTWNSHGVQADGTVNTAFVVRVYPETGSSSFAVIEDDGETQDYLNGARTFTPVEQNLVGNKLTVIIRATTGSFQNALDKRQYVVDVVIPSATAQLQSLSVDRQKPTLKPTGGRLTPQSGGWETSDDGRLISVFTDEKPTNQDKVFVFEFSNL